MDTTILEDIGLTGAEIKVFMTLLELGSTSAGKVVEKSGLQNAVVHRAFHSLTEKGIITYIFVGKVKHYQAIEPKLLLNFLDEKRAKLEKILPEMELKINKQIEKPKATIFEGQRGVKELLNLLIETESKDYFSYGGAQKSSDILGKIFWENFHRRRVEKGIRGKMIFHRSLQWRGEELRMIKLTEVRFTEKNFEELTETIICGEKVGIIIWLDKPFGLLLNEQTTSRSYAKFFEHLWKIAKK